MIVTVNGRPSEFEGSIADLVAAHHGDARGIAVAVNDDVVTHGNWEAHTVAPGDRIEIVTAVQGG
jgi:sulfur carrier protein